jgi:putative transposase
MDGSTLRTTLYSLLSDDRIRKAAARHGVIKRVRKLDIVSFVRALVLSAGSDDSGRQADVYQAYLREVSETETVVRGSFYEWFDEELACMIVELVKEAIVEVRRERRILPDLPGKMRDWLVVDSETVTLSKQLAQELPGTSDRGALKVHKIYSLGLGNIVDVWTSPAKEHDGPHLHVGEWMRDCVLIVDLGYASLDLIRACREHGVYLVMRLKSGWKPTLERLEVDGTEVPLDDGMVLEGLTESQVADFDGSTIDADAVFGVGCKKVRARLVGVPAGDMYHWAVTLLPRGTFGADVVSNIYRTRWGIERSNREDKAGGRLDQIRATTVPSVIILVYASLLRSIICNQLVHLDTCNRPATRAPLHALAIQLAVAEDAITILEAMQSDDMQRWRRIATYLRARGSDPNWRKRPSVWDQFRGITAPPGRPKRPLLTFPWVGSGRGWVGGGRPVHRGGRFGYGGVRT